MKPFLTAGFVPSIFLLIGCTTSSEVALPDLPTGHPALAGNAPGGRPATVPVLTQDDLTRGTASRLSGEAMPPMSMGDKKEAKPAGDAPAKISYTCPMHPEIHKSDPGNCPICGMKLVEEKSSPHSHR
jgi:hypothetical protein